jgi:hypothetical protein
MQRFDRLCFLELIWEGGVVGKRLDLARGEKRRDFASLWDRLVIAVEVLHRVRLGFWRWLFLVGLAGAARERDGPLGRIRRVATALKGFGGRGREGGS